MLSSASELGLVARTLIVVVRGYRLLLSAWIGNACRFEPSCSQYALDALHAHGAGRGSYLAACRIARCNPWCEAGHDPAPSSWQARRRFKPIDLFSRLKDRADS